VTLSGEIVDLIGIDTLHKTIQITRIGHVSVMQEESNIIIVQVLEDVVDSIGFYDA